MPGPIDVFGVAGQSNAAGRGSAELSPVTVAGMAHAYHEPGTLVSPARDPLPGADSGSAWPAFLDTYTATSGRPACVVPAAVGGTAMLPAAGVGYGDWSPTGTLRSTAASRYLDALERLSAAGWEPVWRGVLWHQGENDAQKLGSLPDLSARYAAALLELSAYFRATVGAAEVFVLRLGHRESYASGYAAVRRAQDAVCTRPGHTMVYTECHRFPARGWMDDVLHYSQIGLNHMGSGAARRVAVHLGVVTSADLPPRGATVAQRLRGIL